MLYFKPLLVTALSILFTTLIYGQVGIGTNSPVASAKLEILSTTQGFLPPRMTTAQRDQISSPAIGLIIFNTTTDILEIRTSSGWLSLKVVSSSQEIASIKIGNQIWMLENLNVTSYRDGTPIPEVTSSVNWASLTNAAWCWPTGYSNNEGIYGRLYNWYAAMGIHNAESMTNISSRKNICPIGWHLPTDAEWSELASFLGVNAGGKLKASGFETPNTGATNASGFTGLPGGLRSYNGTIGNIGTTGYWWSSTEDVSDLAWYRYIYANSSLIFRYSYFKTGGMSIRCVRD